MLPILVPFDWWARLCGLGAWRWEPSPELAARGLSPITVGPHWFTLAAFVAAALWTAWAWDNVDDVYRYKRKKALAGFGSYDRATLRRLNQSIMAMPWLMLATATLLLSIVGTWWQLAGPLSLWPIVWAARLRWRARHRAAPQV